MANPSTPASAQRSPVRLDVAALPTLRDCGFTGGRNSFRSFCSTVFAADEPRFLRTDDNDLVVFRHADLRSLGIMPELANVPPAVLFAKVYEQAQAGRPAVGMAVARVISNQVFTANPPIHGPIRRMLLDQIGPRQTAQMEDLARATVQRILEETEGAGEIDLVADVAHRLTARFWAAHLGMTDEEAAATEACVQSMTPLFFVERTLDEFRLVDEAFARYGELVERAALRSLGEGGHPMVEALAAGLSKIDLEDDPAGAGIVPQNVGALLAGNLFDGFHTAAVAAANTVYTLLRHPEALATLRASPHLMERAVFESLRLEPPILYLKRYVSRDIEYDGMLIPEGTLAVMFWAAGNHDPSAFPAPADFDLSRSHQGLSTFGAGPHICPGRFVAVMLARALLETLRDRVEPGLADEPDAWIDNLAMSQLKTLPLRIRSRARE